MKTKILLVALGLLVLSGCTPTTSSTTPPAGGDDSSGADVSAPCFVGTWDLDVAQFEDDATPFASTEGVPLAELFVGGTQSLEITADGRVVLRTDLTVDSRVESGAFTHSWSSNTLNHGDGNWSSTSDDMLTISDFDFYTSEVTTSEEGAPVFSGCDFTAVPSVHVECDQDRLFLTGPDAPYGTYWTRR